MNTFHFIVFSRSRPLQLHGYLSSLYAHWQGSMDELRVSVLVQALEPYVAAYERVKTEFPQVVWRQETNFADDVGDLVDDKVLFTSFGCDDVVFVAPLRPGSISGGFDHNPPIIGLSLRLGLNVTRDMFGVYLPQPEFINPDVGHRLMWDVTHGRSLGDWGYPWEVLGTVYPTTFVRAMVDEIRASSPSWSQARGADIWSRFTDLRHMSAFTAPRLVVPTVNIIQREFPGNGIRGHQPLDPEFLLECWLNGLRLDTGVLVGMKPPSWRVADFPLRRMAA